MQDLMDIARVILAGQIEGVLWSDDRRDQCAPPNSVLLRPTCERLERSLCAAGPHVLSVQVQH